MCYFSIFCFVHGNILQNMTKLHSISVCACFHVCRYNVCAEGDTSERTFCGVILQAPSACSYLFIIHRVFHQPRTHQVDYPGQPVNSRESMSVSPALALEAPATMPAFVLWVQRI